MHAERRLLASFALLLGLQLVTSLGAIALLARMAPAIEHILEENVYSARAVEDMLAILARPGPAGDSDRRAFSDALQRAKENVTEPSEPPALQRLSRVARRALDAEPKATREAIGALRELGRINREAMQRADREAGRLGSAGAWAAVFLGLLTLTVGVLAMVATRRRILDPLREIASTADAHGAGELHRRCTLDEPATQELEAIATTMNALLDYRDRFGIAPHPQPDERQRELLLALLDARDEPSAIVDENGGLIAVSRPALDLLEGSMGEEIRSELREAPAGRQAGKHIASTRDLDGQAWICTLRADT